MVLSWFPVICKSSEPISLALSGTLCLKGCLSKIWPFLFEVMSEENWNSQRHACVVRFPYFLVVFDSNVKQVHERCSKVDQVKSQMPNSKELIIQSGHFPHLMVKAWNFSIHDQPSKNYWPDLETIYAGRFCKQSQRNVKDVDRPSWSSYWGGFNGIDQPPPTFSHMDQRIGEKLIAWNELPRGWEVAW